MYGVLWLWQQVFRRYYAVAVWLLWRTATEAGEHAVCEAAKVLNESVLFGRRS